MTEGGAADRTITIPSSYSRDRGAAITSFILPANGTVDLTWHYDGSTYFIFGDPMTPAQVKTALAIVEADVSGLTASLAGKAAASHAHSAGDITSGLLAVARGGTNTATPGLVAGTDITITGTWPNQTVTSTASGGGGGAAVSTITVMSGGTATNDATAPVIAAGAASPATTALVVSGGAATISDEAAIPGGQPAATAAQVSARSGNGVVLAKDLVATPTAASQTEVNAFADNTKFVTPLTLGNNAYLHSIFY